MLSGLTLRSIEHDDPNVAVTVAARRLRAIYRRVVTAAGIYWYVSLPFVALLVIALTGSIFYAFLVLGLMDREPDHLDLDAAD